MSTAETKPKPKRRLLQFSLASLLAVVTVVGVWLGPIVNRVRHQQRVVAKVQSLGGNVAFAHETSGQGAPSGPPWLSRWLGDDYFRTARHIELQGTAADDDLVEQISRLHGIEQLGLTQTKITDESLRHIARMKRLKALSVGFNPITNEGLAHLAPLDELLFLDLDVTKVTDEGLPALKELPQLYHLKLYGNPITDSGAAALAEMPQLGELDLGNTLVSDNGIEHLVRLPNLTRLRLDQMITGQGQELRITDAGLEHVARMTKLIDLGLISLAVSDAGLAQLKARRPGLIVQH
jgi:hypothetical protein